MDIYMTNAANNIKALCKRKGIQQKDFLDACGLSRVFVANMKKGCKPSIENLILTADYFGVSLDTLVRVDINTIDTKEEFTMKTNLNVLTEAEAELLRLYRSLSDLEQFKTLSYVESKSKAAAETDQNVG